MKKSRGQLEAESALEHLHERGVTRFVHFTSLDNLDSILERGLVPRRTLNDEGIDYLANDQLRLDGLDHVNLSITHPNIKFFYKIRKTYPERYYVVLAIRPDVLLAYTGDGDRRRYSFSNTNAASNRAMSCNVEQLFSGQRPIGFKDEWTTDPQAEVLIPGPIPPEYIESIILPSDYAADEDRLDKIKQLESKLHTKGLDCSFQVYDIIFDNLRDRMLKASPEEKLEYYFLSWQSSEADYIFLESEIEKLPSRSHFGSIAVPLNMLSSYAKHYSEPENGVVWTLEFHKPTKHLERSNEEMTALAVIEKILNRSSVGTLSGSLEEFLYNAVFGSDEARLNESSWVNTYVDCVSQAHQIQCSLVELAKYQRIGKDAKISFVRNGIEDNNLAIVSRAAIDDLVDLSQTISDLYGCESPFKGVAFANAEDSPDFVVNYAAEGNLEGCQEAHLSAFMRSTAPCYYDPIQVQVPAQTHPTPGIMRSLLKYIFRFDDFREGQYPALARALNREDAIVLLPTGSGKSVIFQLLALVTPGTAFIVSPITSLIDDQVQNLETRGIDRVVGLTGKTKDKRAVERRLATGQYLMCYVSPERFQIQSFISSVRNYASENLVSVVAIDEAHCVSEWGHDFRTSYLGLARNCREICRTGDAIPPLLALTGTASTSVLIDMKNDLGITTPGSIIKPETFDRSELHYRVFAANSEDKLAMLDEIMQEWLPNDLGVTPDTLYTHTGNLNTMGGIVFCQNANGFYGLMNSERALQYGHPGVWDHLNEEYPGECSYYCGTKPKRLTNVSEDGWAKDKAEQALKFKENESSIMVATKAFGMGIDKPNVRWVIHYGMPSSLESYYQEVGRAARDKKDAYAYLILSDDYPELNDDMLDPTESNLARLKKLEDTKEQFKGDDVSRCLHFHKSTFSGVDEELEVARRVFEMCGRDNYYDKRWHVPFKNARNENSPDSKNMLERAIYRLTLLGAFKGYTVEYTGFNEGEFLIEPVRANGQELREIVANNYLEYIKSYQSDSAFLQQSRRSLENAVSGIEEDREYILHVLGHLLTNFTYKVIEEGRRRAIMTMLDASRKAAQFEYLDEAEVFLREQIVGYLSTGSSDDEESGLASILYDATDVGKLLRVIDHSISTQEEGATLQQALRLLEDYPQHYGLYFIAAAIQARERDVASSTRSVRSMVHFGTENYGLSAEQCAHNFMRFLGGTSADPVGIETKDKLLIELSGTTGVSYGTLLDELPRADAQTISNLDSLERLMNGIDKELRWKTTSTKR